MSAGDTRNLAVAQEGNLRFLVVLEPLRLRESASWPQRVWGSERSHGRFASASAWPSGCWRRVLLEQSVFEMMRVQPTATFLSNFRIELQHGVGEE